MRSPHALDRAIRAALTESSGRIVVGYSGGLDSTVLLHAAAELGEVGRLLALHVNHGLSRSADDWQRHCESVSHDLGVAFDARRVHVASEGSLEGAAREARYRIFAAVLGAGDTLWLGHHRDDQVETLVWRFLRGADLASLAGMPRSRALGAGRLLRPLLDVERAELLDWGRARDLRWIEDDSNADVGFDRNFLRHDVLPTLRRRWPGLDARLTRAAARFAEDAAIVRDALDARLADVGAQSALPVSALDASGGTALLRHWLARHGLEGIRERVLREILRQARSAGARVPVVDVAPERTVRRHGAALYVVDSRVDEPFAAFAWKFERQAQTPAAVLVARRGESGLRGDVDAAEVRPRRGGERLQPAGRGGSRSVKRLLHDAGVAPWLRAHYPLIYVDERLAAVPGIAVDAAFASRAGNAWGFELQWRAAGVRVDA